MSWSRVSPIPPPLVQLGREILRIPIHPIHLHHGHLSPHVVGPNRHFGQDFLHQPIEILQQLEFSSSLLDVSSPQCID
ncbi:hypothetical protein PsorP6_001050 [Peronosclerospora sorghi]|uniref:Uncharacterized protein n=1 Tax=Peronosclerospora sorghi TaxID=230839 RepID=A0ACC0WPP9_9STRA|nr:hypothetical protein PsorP6_001050 [Peronosclerospora sorghi]